MSWLLLSIAFLTIGMILYILIYAEDHWLDEDEDELQNNLNSDSTS